MDKSALRRNMATRRRRGLLAAALALAVLFAADSFYGLEKNAVYYNKKGWEFLKKGDSFRAIASFKNALKKNARYKEALIGLGKAYLATDGYEESLRLFADAMKLDRDNGEAITGSGFAMKGLGRYSEALKYFDMALAKSEENLDAKYGLASIYYLMEKKIWAKRKLEGVLRIDPYHYSSLLLMADLKSDDNRPGEAKKFIEKAVGAHPDLPDGYVKYGQLLVKDYLRSDHEDDLEEAMEEFNKALAIHPDNLQANRSLGYVYLLKKSYSPAARYFQKSLASYPENGISLYHLAVACAKEGNLEDAVSYYKKAVKAAPSDSLLLARFEDFLILNQFKIGNPERVNYSREHFKMSLKRGKENMAEDAVMHLRRALFLNPMNREARETLRDSYLALDYYKFYVDEMKDLLQMYPEEKYQEMLNIAIIKRRNMLYHRAGYSQELPPRDVPRVLVMDFSPRGELTPHLDAGEVLANYLTFALGQFGRMQPVGVKKRLEICRKLKPGDDALGDSMETLGDMVKKGDPEGLDYVVFGDYREGAGFVSYNARLMDFHTGVVIGEFPLFETGKDNVPKLSLRAARRIYDMMPFKGRILKMEEEDVIVNLGLFDGVKEGDLLVIYKFNESRTDRDNRLNVRKKIILRVKESDTLVVSAGPQNADEFRLIDENDAVYPLQKRRAKLIK